VAAIEAFSDARAALDRLEVPAELADPAGATGAAITIRSGGRIVARGVGVESERGRLRGALAEALGAFRETRLVPRDAARDDALAALAERSTLELELAGELVPIEGDAFVHAALTFSPGLHGAAAKAGSRVSMVFPDQMLATNTPAPQALAAACATLGFQGRELGELRREEGVRVYRFETLSLAQLEPGSAPVFLHRGGRVRPITSVVGSELTSFGHELARSLEARVWPGPEPMGLLGAYDPLLDRFDPLVAAPEEQALCALALATWSAAAGREPAARAAADILTDLHARIESGELALEPVVAGLAALALEELPGADESLDALRRACAGELAGAGATETLSGRAIVAAARARLKVGDAAGLTREVLSEAGRDRLVSAAPWIVWAAKGASEGGAPLGAVALREARELVWEHQFTRADAGAENADLVGGIVFTSGQQPLPSAQSARAAALAAAMLGDPALTPETERARELARLLPTLRFLRQLAVEETEARLFPTAERARGAVRLAVWDQRQPPEATAMTLLAVAETVRATK